MLSGEEREALAARLRHEDLEDRSVSKWEAEHLADALAPVIERIVAARVEEALAVVEDGLSDPADHWWHTGGTPCMPKRAIRDALRAAQPAAEGASTPEASKGVSGAMEGARGTCPDHPTIPRTDCACPYAEESE